jgi:hypothetical protein
MLYVSNFHKIFGYLQHIFFYKELVIFGDQSLDMLMMTNQNREWNNIFTNVKHVWTYMRSFKTFKKMVIIHLNVDKHIARFVGDSMLLHAVTWKFSLERCKYDTSKS